ncbi:MAG: hypothetical protein PHG19_04815 [Anaerotignum sp.]|nr:hypothetical protein [Anaerotignum sp.]
MNIKFINPNLNNSMIEAKIRQWLVVSLERRLNEQLFIPKKPA